MSDGTVTETGAAASRELIVLVDVSGSMRSDGKIQALNATLEETLPLLRTDPAAARTAVHVCTFGSEARWHERSGTALASLTWPTLHAERGGLTETGAAINLVTDLLDRTAPDAAPPAILLCTDGMATDTTAPMAADALARLDSHPIGRRTLRCAVTIGRDADTEFLDTFVATTGGTRLDGHDPTRIAANLPLGGPPAGDGPVW